MTGADVSSRLMCSNEGTFCWGCLGGGISRREVAVTPLDEEPYWVTNSSTLVAPDLPLDLLRRGTGGGSFFDNVGGRDGPLDDLRRFWSLEVWCL